MKTAVSITAEDFERIAPVLGPCELVRGEIVTLSPAGVRHNRVTGNVFFLLERHNRRHKLGRVLTNETGIVVDEDPDTVRGADILFISYKRLPASRDWTGFLRQAPELVVEVLAEGDSWKKIEEKVPEYHAFGVEMVWVVDPKTVSVRLYPKGRPASLLQAHAEIAGGSVFPRFRCRIAKFFAA